jgi:glucose-6-phosphate isomerase
LDYAESFKDPFALQIVALGKEIKEMADVLVVLGIGGSYLGSKTLIDGLNPFFKKSKTEIIFAGHQLSGVYLEELLESLEGRSVYVNVISKSGTTLETALAFRFLMNFMRSHYPDTWAERIIATTDPEKGALRTLCDREGIRSLPIPADIGGRYSVFTAVGLLPAAVAGIDITDLLMGLKKGIVDFGQADLKKNLAYQYAATRHMLYKEGKRIELFALHHPALMSLGEWLKQLFGESDGKNGRGLFPAAAMFSTDLHSLGQWIQDGKRNIFETMINIENSEKEVCIPSVDESYDGLDHLVGRPMQEIDRIMMASAMKAHLSGGVPVVSIQMERLDAYHLAYLMYFSMRSCAMSGYLADINPFDQQGVEAYKQNMREMMQE